MCCSVSPRRPQVVRDLGPPCRGTNNGTETRQQSVISGCPRTLTRRRREGCRSRVTEGRLYSVHGGSASPPGALGRLFAAMAHTREPSCKAGAGAHARTPHRAIGGIKWKKVVRRPERHLRHQKEEVACVSRLASSRAFIIRSTAVHLPLVRALFVTQEAVRRAERVPRESVTGS